MHHLPPRHSPLRELFTVEQLVAIHHDHTLASTLPAAKAEMRRMTRRDPAIKRGFFLCLDAKDRLNLVSVGPRGGHKTEWTFGPI